MEPTVEVNEGKLLGTIKTNINGDQFYGFQGVPFAKPPLGNLRFKAPQPPEKWEGIRKAIEDGNGCYSKNFNGYSGSEDCLYLNVFTKNLSGTELKPVMVWIHGGAFTKGSNATDLYGPEYLMIEDIVLVTINYRLGPLGFLILQDVSLGVPGNAGLKDIVISLKWVQRNIRMFSGDPNNVTIFGESAGGAAVHLLMLSPMSKGLFHKAIAQSGTALNGWTQCKVNGTYQLAEKLEIHSKDDSVILKHLQEISVEELVKGLEKVTDPFHIGVLRPFAPTVEKPSNEPAFLTEDPMTLLKLGKYHDVPFILGCCSREGIFIYGLCTNAKTSHLLRDETIVPFNLHLRKGSDKYETVKMKILQFYFGTNDPTNNRSGIYRMYTDNYFLYDVYRTAKYHRNTSTQPIYFYYFDMDTELNIMKKLYGIEENGCSHADDIAYLFKTELTNDLTPNSTEDITVRRLVRMWTNFAKFNAPTPKKSDRLLNNLEWNPINKEKFHVLHIDDNLKMLTEHPEIRALEFWENLYNVFQINSKL